MHALVYHGPGQKAWEEVPDPEIIDEGDAIVRVDATTICGTDLHILAGDVPEVRAGTILGHEAVGTVDEVGDGVHRLSPGDRVLVSCISACGTCQYCREGRYGQCLDGGGWVLGHRIDGTQAEYVRVPYADTSTYRIPDGVSDEAMLMLADILPTGYEVGVLAGGVRPGDVVAVVGAGPVGLSAIASARLFSPSHIVAVDLSDARLEAARHFGADVTINDAREDPMAVIKELTGRLGADVAIEAVGTAGHLRDGRAAGPAGRPDREHRRARQRGRAAPGRAVGQGHHDHHRAGGRLVHPDPDAAGRLRPARRRPVRHPPLRPGRLRQGLRGLRRRRRQRRAQGRADPRAKEARADERRVKDVMTTQVIPWSEDTPFEAIAAALRAAPGQRVPGA